MTMTKTTEVKYLILCEKYHVAFLLSLQYFAVVLNCKLNSNKFRERAKHRPAGNVCKGLGIVTNSCKSSKAPVIETKFVFKHPLKIGGATLSFIDWDKRRKYIDPGSKQG